jgi:Flavin reductase like domain
MNFESRSFLDSLMNPRISLAQKQVEDFVALALGGDHENRRLKTASTGRGLQTAGTRTRRPAGGGGPPPPKIMAMSWHTMMDFEPPLIGCVIGGNHHTFGLLKALRECVIAVPTVEMASTVVKVGNRSGRNTSKFKKFGIATLSGSAVRAPLLAQCWANIECVVADECLVKKYDFLC